MTVEERNPWFIFKPAMKLRSGFAMNVPNGSLNSVPVRAALITVRACARHTGKSEDYPDSPVIDRFNQRSILSYYNGEAKCVALAGSFNDWKPNAMLFKKNGRGIWKAEISILPKGTHLYRFVIDNKLLVADPDNSHREHDGFGGMNSKITIG